MLAYAEARKSDRSDWHASDIILRRSTDGGRTWSAPTVIGAMAEAFPKNPAAVAKKLGLGPGAGVTYNNPVAIADRNGAVHFLFCVEYMRAFYMRSDDDGKTFSKPVEITAAFADFRRYWAWVVLATGPGHGIQLKNGRLVVPVWLSLGTGGGAHGESVTSVIYSDNHGADVEGRGDRGAEYGGDGVAERDGGGATGRWAGDAECPLALQGAAADCGLQQGWRAALERAACSIRSCRRPVCFASMVRLGAGQAALRESRLGWRASGRI